ncbi:MAG: HpcH/HpaI aldolase [Anaerosporomusa subterranea]|jgi:2-dehydro-3-deoxyglucarate aldolase/4-hydroxy-2-oxoheptanedioate aldolase|nr:HpcH/HpaI aldolase [Anaerosporomusa subterranea]
MRNDLKARLKQGDSVLGTMITVFDNPEIVKILKVCGFDFFVIDCEHGGFDYSAVANMLALSREAGIPGIIRIPEVKREVVLKYMEMGAGGLLLPNTDTAEQAKLLVEYAKYYPLGNRGVSLLRPHTGFEKVDSAVQYMQALNAETVLMTQIESPAGVKNVEAILDVDGIDAVFIGPNDLSQSMGIMGQTDHPDFIAAVEHVIAAAREKGKYSGMHLMSCPALKPWIDKGMSLNLLGNEIVFMMNSAKPAVAEVKNK